MTGPRLFDYFRSSASYRVRIALNLKRMAYQSVPVNLLEGAQKADTYRNRNPQGFVPTLEIDGHRLTQSLAIIAYLDQTRPDPPLLPADPADAAHVRSLALVVSCDIHPLSNLRVRKHLVEELGISQDARLKWDQKWISEGLAALEAMAAPRAGRFLFGDSPTLADICLVPQMFNARRFEVPLDNYPTLVRADAEATRLEAFAAAHPDAIGPEA
ncbi:MAG: maleylacetoacetate isomerase [Allosphingosinicella sp.]